MKPLRVYLDTSVFGGCFDDMFSQDSLRVLEAVKSRKLTAIISRVLVRELEPAPERVRGLLQALPEDAVHFFDITSQSLDLRDEYIAAGVLSDKWRNDALHVALATAARADAIVSWNFKHIVRLDKIKGFNAVNFRLGYGVLTIISPKECLTDAQADE